MITFHNQNYPWVNDLQLIASIDQTKLYKIKQTVCHFPGSIMILPWWRVQRYIGLIYYFVVPFESVTLSITHQDSDEF